MTFEHWADAYSRILDEVRAENPEWDDVTVYQEYRLRCALWKRGRGLRLNPGDLEALGEK